MRSKETRKRNLRSTNALERYERSQSLEKKRVHRKAWKVDVGSILEREERSRSSGKVIQYGKIGITALGEPADCYQPSWHGDSNHEFKHVPVGDKYR